MITWKSKYMFNYFFVVYYFHIVFVVSSRRLLTLTRYTFVKVTPFLKPWTRNFSCKPKCSITNWEGRRKGTTSRREPTMDVSFQRTIRTQNFYLNIHLNFNSEFKKKTRLSWRFIRTSSQSTIRVWSKNRLKRQDRKEVKKYK